MDVKLDYYNDTSDIWTTPKNGIFLIFNETLDIIQYQIGVNTLWGWIFIIPTPLNLTMIGKYINYTTGGFFASMSISGTTLTLVHSFFGSIYEYNYDNNGILTKFTIELSSILIHEMVIETDVPDDGSVDGGDENGIPFGNTYVLITITGILISIISIRRKIVKN